MPEHLTYKDYNEYEDTWHDTLDLNDEVITYEILEEMIQDKGWFDENMVADITVTRTSDIWRIFNQVSTLLTDDTPYNKADDQKLCQFYCLLMERMFRLSQQTFVHTLAYFCNQNQRADESKDIRFDDLTGGQRARLRDFTRMNKELYDIKESMQNRRNQWKGIDMPSEQGPFTNPV